MATSERMIEPTLGKIPRKNAFDNLEDRTGFWDTFWVLALAGVCAYELLETASKVYPSSQSQRANMVAYNNSETYDNLDVDN